MEFGKADPASLSNVDFNLPADGQQTCKCLTGIKNARPLFFMGCAKWGRKEWVDLIYPPKTKADDFLSEYVKHFNSIELNATFYSVPAEEQIRKWKTQALSNGTGDFLFCPKFPKIITHTKRLKHAEQVTDEFITNIYGFGETLGPSFIQLSDQFGPENLSVLEEYLKFLPDDLKVFIELRHPGWFGDADARKQVFEIFNIYKKGAVITDVTGRRDILHMELTIPEVFIRFVGNGLAHQSSDFARIDQWAVRIKAWMDRGLNGLYFFIHQQDEVDTLTVADYALNVFNKELGARIPEVFAIKPLFFGVR